jgi:hypothetical protein
MITRDELTKIFLKQSDKSVDDVNLKMYSRKWWKSTRVNIDNSFRLSNEGILFLTEELKLKSYEIPFAPGTILSPLTIIFLEKTMDCPYYLTNNSIIVFSEKKGVELLMFTDDINKFALRKAVRGRS